MYLVDKYPKRLENGMGTDPRWPPKVIAPDLP